MKQEPRSLDLTLNKELFDSVLWEILARTNTVEYHDVIETVWPWEVTQIPIKVIITQDTEVRLLEYK